MPTLKRRLPSSVPFLSFLFLCLWGRPFMAEEAIPITILIPLGVVLDLNSTIGNTANSCIWMAHQDFYKHNRYYKTRLDLLTKDSGENVVTAATAAQDLIKKKVNAIIGPQTSEQAWFVIELGSKAQVPIISFSATSPSLSPTRKRNHYFIRLARDDSSQVEAIASVVKAFGWREIIPVYPDTEYGNGLIPYLNDAFVQIGTRVPYRSVIGARALEAEIRSEIQKLKGMTTRVFLVHMDAKLGCRFFQAAKKAGVMTAGYAWMVTEGLSAEVDPSVLKCMNSMQGVLGVRPGAYNNSSRLKDFKERWKALSGKTKSESDVVSVFGLRAYDAVWALAEAVEKVWVANSTFPKQNVSLLKTILATKFSGLTGDINLVKGQLEPSTLEVFNVVEQTERIVGYWIPGLGTARGLSKLKQVRWPGNTTKRPPKLRIGIPIKKGVNDFKKVKNFSFDVFYEVLSVLPFPLPYKFVPFEKNGETAGNYDELVMQIHEKKYDAVVGDVTIVANRSKYVDFTMPFSESGVSMLVLAKHDDRRNMWIFLKPLSWDLWLVTGAAILFTGFIIWFIEHRSNSEFGGTTENQFGRVLWFSFSTLVFAYREKIVTNWARFVLIIWVFVVLIITQSYTASLASLLTVQKLQPVFMDVEEIKSNNYFVGYQKKSFVRGLLIEHLGLNESMLIGYDSPEAYHQALSLGSDNGGVAAIFDEIFFINLFLTKYGSGKYKMVGPTYKTDGLGFAFPRNSPLVASISRAILNITQNKTRFDGIKKRYFSSDIISNTESASMSIDSPNLTVESFGGLFIISLITSLLALLVHLFKFLHSKWMSCHEDHQFCSESPLAMMIKLGKHFNKQITFYNLVRMGKFSR